MYSGSRIIKNKIRKVINCDYHSEIVNKRKQLLKELHELENNHGEFIPRVVREINNKFMEFSSLPNRDVISQTVEF